MTDEQKQQTRDRIGLRIMALRKLAGLTQEQLSERAGLQRSHVSDLAPLRTLTEPMIGSLGTALNKKVTEVFTPKDAE